MVQKQLKKKTVEAMQRRKNQNNEHENKKIPNMIPETSLKEITKILNCSSISCPGTTLLSTDEKSSFNTCLTTVKIQKKR